MAEKQREAEELTRLKLEQAAAKRVRLGKIQTISEDVTELETAEQI